MKLDVSSDESSDEDEEAGAAAEGAEGGDEGSTAGKATAAVAAAPVPQDVLDNVSRLRNEGSGVPSPLLSRLRLKTSFSLLSQRHISLSPYSRQYLLSGRGVRGRGRGVHRSA